MCSSDLSEDEIATGVTEIDEIAQDNSYTYRMNLNLQGIGNYIDGEIVYKSNDGTWANNTAYATIKEWYKANGTMFVYDITGDFTANTTDGNLLYGNSSHAIRNVLSYADEKNDYVSFDIFDNKNLDTGADLILDLSETNPFGNP